MAAIRQSICSLLKRNNGIAVGSSYSPFNNNFNYMGIVLNKRYFPKRAFSKKDAMAPGHPGQHKFRSDHHKKPDHHNKSVHHKKPVHHKTAHIKLAAKGEVHPGHPDFHNFNQKPPIQLQHSVSEFDGHQMNQEYDKHDSMYGSVHDSYADSEKEGYVRTGKKGKVAKVGSYEDGDSDIYDSDEDGDSDIYDSVHSDEAGDSDIYDSVHSDDPDDDHESLYASVHKHKTNKKKMKMKKKENLKNLPELPEEKIRPYAKRQENVYRHNKHPFKKRNIPQKSSKVKRAYL